MAYQPICGHLDSNKLSAACQVLSNLLKILVNWPLNFHPERSEGSASRLRHSPGLPHACWLPGNSSRFRFSVRLTILAMVTSLIKTSGARGKDFTSARSVLYARTTPAGPATPGICSDIGSARVKKRPLL